MPRSRRLGADAEDKAARFLQEIGYTIVTRNFHATMAEIDIIAMDGDTLVCVEVRQRKKGGWDLPEASIGGKKQKKLWEAAEIYLVEVAGKAMPVRFDIVALEGEELRHHKDAFRP